MQDRIKELAVEAGLHDRHGFILFESRMERFAQAVARECAKLCDDDGTLDAAYCAQAIRARFGLGE